MKEKYTVKTLIIISILVIIILECAILACCKAAGRSDEIAEEQYLKYIKSKQQANNINQNNEGE